MKTRQRIAVADRAIAAAFRPADNGEEAEALPIKPGTFLAGGEGDIGFGPAPRPIILRPVEPGSAEPILQRQLVGVADAQPALLRRIDEKQAAERPEGLAAEILLALLIDHD